MEILKGFRELASRMEHKARVESVGDGCVNVVMHTEGACVSCKAKAVCGTGEGEERRISVHTPDASDYRPGEQVIVSVERSMGMRAVAIAYIYPFMIMLAVLLALLECGAGELIAGLASLGAAAVYFFVVYLLRDKIEREIVFTLRKS